VDPRDDCAAPVVFLHEVELPHRSRGIQRRRDEAGDQRLQLLPAGLAGQRGDDQMPVDVEMTIGLQIAKPGNSTACWWKRRNTRNRSSMTRFKRSARTRPLNIRTPQIIMRLCGRSMRSQAVSTAEILSRAKRGAMACRTEEGRADAFVARVFGLK
jgi:hypothetical protein